MKKLILLVGGISLLLQSHVLVAKVMLHSNSLDGCQPIAGTWIGSGKASHWLIGECVYHGTGSVSVLGSNGAISIEVIATKDSGNFVCPNHTKKHLKGTCSNGTISIMTDFGNLNGVFSENQGSSNGSLEVSPGVDVAVSIHFSRQN